MLQWVWEEIDYWLDMCHVTKGGHIQHLRGMQKKSWRVSLSICTLHVIILLAIKVYKFYDMCDGIMNNLAFCNLWPVWLYHIFPHYLINRMILKKKKVIEHEMCVLIFSTSHFKKNSARYYHKWTQIFT